MQTSYVAEIVLVCARTANRSHSPLLMGCVSEGCCHVEAQLRWLMVKWIWVESRRESVGRRDWCEKGEAGRDGE